MTHSFSELNPDAVLDALANIGLVGDGRILPLNSYENRVFQIGIEDGLPLVVKFYRAARWTDAAIKEEHQFVEVLSEHEIPVVSPLKINDTTLHEFHGFRFAVFPKQGGRAPELELPGTLEWIGRFMGRIHAIGALGIYRQRPVLDIKSFGVVPSTYLLAHHFIPSDLIEVYRSVIVQALDGVRRCFDRAGQVNSLRTHGDAHVGNILWTDLGPHFVDFDDSRMAPAIQDLWMLLSGTPAEMAIQLNRLLEGYEDFYEFNPREIYLIEGLRTLRLIHYSAWIAQRWNDPAFTTAFPWFNTQRYWQDRILELREQIAIMDENPSFTV